MARPATHPRLSRRRAWCGALVVLAAAMLAAGPAGVSPAVAQMLTFPPRPKPPVKPDRGQEQMLVRAEEINYDYSNERVSAVGNVQLYFGNSTLEADRVIYDQKTKRLHAEGQELRRLLPARPLHRHRGRDPQPQRPAPQDDPQRPDDAGPHDRRHDLRRARR